MFDVLVYPTVTIRLRTSAPSQVFYDNGRVLAGVLDYIAGDPPVYCIPEVRQLVPYTFKFPDDSLAVVFALLALHGCLKPISFF